LGFSVDNKICLIVIIFRMSQEFYGLPLHTKYETLGKQELVYGMHVLNEVTLRQDCCLHQL